MALAFRLLRYNLIKIVTQRPTMSRGISSSPQLLNEAVEELKANPYYEKYAKKIASLQSTSPEEFLNRIESSVASKKAKTGKEKEQAPMTSGKPKPILENKPQLTKTKLLADYMKIELLANQPVDEIKRIWLEYHKDKDVIAAVIPLETYQLMHGRGKEFPTFLLPLPRNQGYEFIVCQFYGHEVHFTPLIAYQTHRENAPECLAMVHYTELADKGVVLMKGDYNTDVLQAHEAQCLSNEIQLYYAQNHEKRLNMLRRFTHAPDEFQHMDLIADMECLTL